MSETKISDILAPAFYNSWKQDRNNMHNVEKGGRNTGKTVKHCVRMVFNRMKNKTSGLCIRKFQNQLRDSVFQDIRFAINLIGVQDYWKPTYSPLKWTYLPWGNEILFRGADRPDRLKGIKANFPISDCLFDEIIEFKYEEDLDIVIDSVLRSKIVEEYKFFYAYNPPKRKNHWCNKKYNTAKPIPETHIHHSVIYDNPHVAQQVLQRAEIMKKENINKFKWVYLGEAIGGGVIPFENLVFRKITDEEYASFDNIKCGLDWGYANDIFAYVRCHYDKTRKKIYLLDEVAGLQLKNIDISEKIILNNFKERIIADSAAPKDIAICKDLGLDIIGAKKGSGSVESGERWLNDLNEIIIDWDRTPKAAKQFEDIDYQVDKEGNILRRLEDKENDFIDAVRYAMEYEIKPSTVLY